MLSRSKLVLLGGFPVYLVHGVSSLPVEERSSLFKHETDQCQHKPLAMRLSDVAEVGSGVEELVEEGQSFEAEVISSGHMTVYRYPLVSPASLPPIQYFVAEWDFQV